MFALMKFYHEFGTDEIKIYPKCAFLENGDAWTLGLHLKKDYTKIEEGTKILIKVDPMIDAAPFVKGTKFLIKEGKHLIAEGEIVI